MTLDDAQKVAAIISTADSGCSTCVGHLMERAVKAFPIFTWSYEPNPEPEPPEDDDADPWETGDRYLDHVVVVRA